ncbi:MAG: hypothetical protein SOY26_07920 [Paludibacteraceae bacterium]|nr:hypothetical protein [Paludibacteraceae bacterium]
MKEKGEEVLRHHENLFVKQFIEQVKVVWISLIWMEMEMGM